MASICKLKFRHYYVYWHQFIAESEQISKSILGTTQVLKAEQKETKSPKFEILIVKSILPFSSSPHAYLYDLYEKFLHKNSLQKVKSN